MSKVIKACFVRDKEAKLELPEDGSVKHVEFTKEDANELYMETKLMLEELVAEARKKAETIISNAEKEAEGILNNSQAEYENIKKKAYEEGLNSGYQEGIEKAKEEIQALTDKNKLLVNELVNFKKKYIQDNMDQLIDLVMCIAQKILHTVVELKPEIITNIVRNVLTEAGEAEKFIIKVNPLHLPYLKDTDQQDNEVNNNHLCFEGDPEIAPGGCVVITENGFIEAKLDEQILVLQKALKEERNNVGL